MIIHTSGLPAIGDDETMLAEEYFYLIGSTAPRYPVPAIRLSNCYCGWRERINPCDCDCGLFKR